MSASLLAVLIPQSSAPDVWSWGEFIRQVSGPVIAAIFLIVGIWLKDIIEKRNATQAWFEQHYIVEMIDPMVGYFFALRDSLLDIQFDHILRRRASLPVPPSREVFFRFMTILRYNIMDQSSSVMLEISLHHKALGADRDLLIIETLKLERDCTAFLDQLRKELLRVPIRRKTDIYNIAEIEAIAKLSKSLEAKFERTIAVIEPKPVTPSERGQ